MKCKVRGKERFIVRHDKGGKEYWEKFLTRFSDLPRIIDTDGFTLVRFGSHLNFIGGDKPGF